MLMSFVVPVLFLAAAASPVDSVRIEIAPPAGEVMERIAAVAARELTERSNIEVVRSGTAPFVIVLATNSTFPREGFEIADGAASGIRITGQDEHSVMYGLGKFLRTSIYGPNSFTPSAWRGTSAPEGSFRAVYAATHFNNYYEAAPADEVSRYLEDLALWGANAVLVHFPTWSFEGFDDPAARRNIEQTRRLLLSAKAVGMKAGLIQCPNQGFVSAPPATRAVANPDPMKRRGNTGVNCCPSTPDGNAYLLDLYTRLFAEYKDIGLDYFLCWPYDEGGCGCAACAPWGGKAFPRLTKAIGAVGRGVFPGLKVILSTWLYDLPPSGEWEGLASMLEAEHAWLDAIMCDDHLDFPRYPLDHGVPAQLPLYNFPEISMWGRSPWGAFGANPLPARYEALWKQTEGKLTGGMPYSEGIFEDMNKVVCFQFYWNRNTPAEETLREYIGFEFSPDAVEDVLQAVRLLESAWLEAGPKSEEAFNMLKEVDAQLSPRARQAWRWRLLYLRGLIDTELARNGNKKEGPILRDAFNELTTLYHAQNAHDAVKPFTIP